MRKLAIIPARGGSKRIPRKNIRNFLGKPIIAYPISCAMQSGLFDEVMVSTEDEEIAETARQYGAKVPFMRSQENANDFAGTLAVIQEVLHNYAQQGKHFDWVCCIYPTAPFVQVEQLQKGFELLKQGEYECVFPAVAFSFPVWRGVRRQSDGKTSMIWPEHVHTRSQDLEPVYHDAGQWYWINAKKEITSILGSKTATVLLDETEVQDIDNESDWIMAEMKYQLKNEQSDKQ